MDDDRVVLSNRGHSSWRTLGLRGPRMGRLLGMGPGGKCLAASLADRHGVPAFGDDAREARHDESLERLAGVLDVYSLHSRYFFDAKWSGQLRPCLCAV